MMEIQQHDGVVVDVAGLRQGFASFCERERGVAGEEGGAQGLDVAALPSPPLYIGPRERGGAALPLPPRKGAAKGGRSPSSPRHLGGAFPF